MCSGGYCSNGTKKLGQKSTFILLMLSLFASDSLLFNEVTDEDVNDAEGYFDMQCNQVCISLIYLFTNIVISTLSPHRNMIRSLQLYDFINHTPNE